MKNVREIFFGLAVKIEGKSNNLKSTLLPSKLYSWVKSSLLLSKAVFKGKKHSVTFKTLLEGKKLSFTLESLFENSRELLRLFNKMTP